MTQYIDKDVLVEEINTLMFDEFRRDSHDEVTGFQSALDEIMEKNTRKKQIRTMKTNFVEKFTGNFLLKVTKDDKENLVPVSAFKYRLIDSWGENEDISLYGENLAAVLPNLPAADEIVKRNDFVFDADIVELKENNELDLIAEMKNVLVVGIEKSHDEDVVCITADHFCWGLSNSIGATMQKIHKKNLETQRETAPDYSNCEDW